VLPRERDARLKARAEAEARRALEEAKSAAAKVARGAGHADLDIFPRLVQGNPFVEIIRRARHTKSDLIVLGSTAERVIRKGDTSILVVGSSPAGAYRRPLVAVDLSDNSHRAFEPALRVVDPSVQTLEVVHAYDILYEGACDGPTRRSESFCSIVAPSGQARAPPSRGSSLALARPGGRQRWPSSAGTRGM
jgi:nucleotide-binding universal stress UspA family protein